MVSPLNLIIIPKVIIHVHRLITCTLIVIIIIHACNYRPHVQYMSIKCHHTGTVIKLSSTVSIV